MLTTDFPEVVQDNTESPVDETALTETFDKTSVDGMDKKKRSQSHLPQVSLFCQSIWSMLWMLTTHIF